MRSSTGWKTGFRQPNKLSPLSEKIQNDTSQKGVRVPFFKGICRTLNCLTKSYSNHLFIGTFFLILNIREISGLFFLPRFQLILFEDADLYTELLREQCEPVFIQLFKQLSICCKNKIVDTQSTFTYIHF
ncbi:MAG: hypothetical protein C0403_19205 [Desulfobacterium sp.]|nr:hypothetical protein [Desulfobacterium sp.]